MKRSRTVVKLFFSVCFVFVVLTGFGLREVSSQESEIKPITEVRVAFRGPALNVRFSSDSKKFVTTKDNAILLYNLDGTLITKFGVKDGKDITKLDYTKGKILSYASNMRKAEQMFLWNESGKQLKTFGFKARKSNINNKTPEFEKSEPYKLMFSKDGKTALAVYNTINFGGIKLWNMKNAKVKKLFKGYKDTKIYGCDVSSDGKIIATMSRDEMIKLWKKNGALIRTIETGDPLNTTYNGRDVCILNNGTIVALRSDIAIWSQKGKKIKTIEKLKHQSSPEFAVTSDDKSMFAVALSEGGVILYNNQGEVIQTFLYDKNGGYGNSIKVYSIDISADNKLLATGDKKGYVKIWNINKK